MTKPVQFILDGRQVVAEAGETIWDVAKREGTLIPHLCHLDQPGYRPDGNCRASCLLISIRRSLITGPVLSFLVSSSFIFSCLHRSLSLTLCIVSII